MDTIGGRTRARTNTTSGVNVQFYKGVKPSAPDGALIDKMHRHWWHNYDKLEVHHGYGHYISHQLLFLCFVLFSLTAKRFISALATFFCLTFQ